MNRLIEIVLRTDGLTILAWIGLILLGLAAVYSCTVDYQSTHEVVPSTVSRAVFHSQLTWAIVGVIVGAMCVLLPFRHFEALAYVGYALALILLVAVLVVGTELGGGRRWLSFGGFTIQPSELAKVALVLSLARLLASRRGTSAPWLVAAAIGLVLPVFVLVFREPDLGTSVVYPAIAVPTTC